MRNISMEILGAVILKLFHPAFLPGPANPPTTIPGSGYSDVRRPQGNGHPPEGGPATLGSSYPGASILGILFLILLPSLVFSVLVRRWARTRTGGRATFE